MIEFKTSMGSFTLTLRHEQAPKTCENFLQYVNEGHFDGTIFHRVIAGFMIQGGGFDAQMSQLPTRDPIANEAANGLKNDCYTVAMARTNDPHSATCQFFINTANNDFLNFSAPMADGWGYAVFGEITQGREVIDAIGSVKTGSHGFHEDVPVEPVVIESARVLA